MITADELAQCWGINLLKAGQWVDAMNPALAMFEVDQELRRIAWFAAQTGHESGCGKYTTEIWGPDEAQLGYEGRKDLGNVRPGDGRKFMGRGLLQITGRANFAAARDHLRQYMPAVPDFEQSPELVALPRWAAYTAALYWKGHGCNELTDQNDYEGVTREINGGLNGWAERVALRITCEAALDVPAYVPLPDPNGAAV